MTGKAFIHLGAHRTGSSSFQVFLGHNRKRLLAAGYNLIYPDRDGAEGGFKKRINLPNPAVAATKHRRQHRTWVKPMREKFAYVTTPERPFTILSEENILGRMRLLFQGRFYPQAGLRLDLIRKGLAQPVDNVVLVIRDYADFYTSAAAMQALFAQRPAFETVLPNLMQNQNDWTDLAERLLQRGFIKQLTILPYELRGTDANLLRHLIGVDLPDLAAPPRRTNISASAQAIAEIQRLHTANTPPSLTERAEIIKKLSVKNGYDRFDPFTRAQRDILSARYAQDLQELAKRDNVRLINDAGSVGSASHSDGNT